MRGRGYLVIRHPGGLDETDVPIAHLADEDEMAAHYQRLAAKAWITAAAVAELAAIADGAGA